MCAAGVLNALVLGTILRGIPSSQISENTWNEADTATTLEQFGFLGLAEHLVGSAVVEEILFRFLPLALLERVGGKYRRTLQLGGSVAVSGVFGYLHGGVANVFLQGVTGFALSLIYLQTRVRSKSHALALFHSARAHLFFNLALLFAAYLRP